MKKLVLILVGAFCFSAFSQEAVKQITVGEKFILNFYPEKLINEQNDCLEFYGKLDDDGSLNQKFVNKITNFDVNVVKEGTSDDNVGSYTVNVVISGDELVCKKYIIDQHPTVIGDHMYNNPEYSTILTKGTKSYTLFFIVNPDDSSVLQVNQSVYGFSKLKNAFTKNHNFLINNPNNFIYCK